MLKYNSIAESLLTIYNATFNFFTLVYGLNINYGIFSSLGVKTDNKLNLQLYNCFPYYLNENKDYLIKFTNSNAHFFYNILFRLCACFQLVINSIYTQPYYLSTILYGTADKSFQNINSGRNYNLSQKIDRGYFNKGNPILINTFVKKLFTLNKIHGASIQSYTVPQVVKVKGELQIFNRLD